MHANQFWWVWPFWFRRYYYFSNLSKFPFRTMDYKSSLSHFTLTFLCIAQLSTLRGLKSIGLTTNGLTLTKKVEKLKNVGLSSVNISLDSLIPQKFEFITRRKGNKYKIWVYYYYYYCMCFHL